MTPIGRHHVRLHPLSAQIVARLFYGLPLPEPARRHDDRCNTGTRVALNHLRKRGAITEDNQVTEFGVRLLQRYVRAKR